ncbi:MAG: TatD family hydrolase [Bacteroidaceae bacterium]
MQIKDIHTHTFPLEVGSALVCIDCDESLLREGHWHSAGLHPWYVTDNNRSSLDALESLLAHPRVLALGECGFDRLRGPSIQLQEDAFLRQVELSEKHCKPMILHVVKDFDRVIRLRKTLKPKEKWLIHGFRGGAEQARQLLASGLLLSFGVHANPDSVRSVPLESLFAETDSKTDIEAVFKSISGIIGKNQSETMEIIMANISDFLA